MKILGIICEYNPLHNGHLYQMTQAREKSGADAVVCVMSGNYVQRGELAITDKWTRTGMALAAGADLVIELPTLFAMSGAQSFARAGVRLLLEAGVDTISFGCESENLELLGKIAGILREEPEGYQRVLREKLDAGESFAVARSAALQQCCAEQAEEVACILDQPGAILGIEYLAALAELGADKEVILIPRQGNGHRETQGQGQYVSASTIRTALKSGQWLSEAMPEKVQSLWQEANSLGKTMPRQDVFTQQLYWRLAEFEVWQLQQTPEIGEGLENRILQCASQVKNWDDLVQEIVCKRYPAARIRRGLMNFCLGINQEVRYRAGWEEGPSYTRILGIGPAGGAVLRRMKSEGTLPILTNPGAQLGELSPVGRQLFAEEVKFTDYYMLALPGQRWYNRGLEYRMEIVKKQK